MAEGLCNNTGWLWFRCAITATKWEGGGEHVSWLIQTTGGSPKVTQVKTVLQRLLQAAQKVAPPAKAPLCKAPATFAPKDDGAATNQDPWTHGRHLAELYPSLSVFFLSRERRHKEEGPKEARRLFRKPEEGQWKTVEGQNQRTRRGEAQMRGNQTKECRGVTTKNTDGSAK